MKRKAKSKEETERRRKRGGRRKEEALHRAEVASPTHGKENWSVRRPEAFRDSSLPTLPTLPHLVANRYKKKLGERTQRTQRKWRHDQTVV